MNLTKIENEKCGSEGENVRFDMRKEGFHIRKSDEWGREIYEILE